MEQTHNAAAFFVRQEIDKIKYPPNHPFNDYPSTPESMILELIVLIKALTNNDNMVRSFLKKCKSVENGNFSNVKYNQNTSEVIWFYYLYTGLIKSNALNSLIHIYDEDVAIFDNGKKFEFSFLISGCFNCLVTSEVKTLTCDPFVKEIGLNCIDGQKLVKPLFPDLRGSQNLREDSSAVVLQASTYYYQLESNIKKIINKCRGNNISGHSLFNIGTVFINASTSFEEFYAYLFHQTKGLYQKLLESNVDALVLISMDAHNDFELNNIYSAGYIQTVLIKPTERNKRVCEVFRMDNYIALGKNIESVVYEKAQCEYGHYKILCREGFVNIIPQDATEDEINNYLLYLKSSNIRT